VLEYELEWELVTEYGVVLAKVKELACESESPLE
jgi:hypothetical protein